MFKFLKRSSPSEHRFCRENLSPFLDGQLSAYERRRVERHLRECPDCRADFESLRQTVALLRTLPSVKLPRSFVLPASEGVRQRETQRSRVAYGYLRLATVMATALLVLVISGDALLRLASVQRPLPLNAPTGEFTAMDKGLPAPEALTTPVAETPAPSSAVRMESAAEATAAPLRAPAAAEASDTPTSEVAADTRGLTVEAVPSQTFARAAGAPPLPTETPEAVGASPIQGPQPTATMRLVPQDAPAAATPMPEPTSGAPAARLIPTVEMPSPQAVAVQAHPEAPPPAQPAGLWPRITALQPLLPWLEGSLALLVVSLLAATLWLRRKQRVV